MGDGITEDALNEMVERAYRRGFEAGKAYAMSHGVFGKLEPSQRIKALMVAKNLTYGEVAAKAGMSKEALRDRVNGHVEFEPREFEPLCQALGLDGQGRVELFFG